TILLLVLAAAARPQETALVWGRVIDATGRPLAAVRVMISSPGANQPLQTSTDEKGFFRLVGLPLGKYAVRFERTGFQPQEESGLYAEPSSRLFFRIRLSPLEGSASSASFRRTDRQDFSRTTIDQEQIRALPSGNNVWNLVENQDLAALTDRIDVGGLHLGQAALFTPRASASWTQTTYGLNGMDVTDPYWTGRPLFYPDLFTLGFTELDNARLPIRSLHPGAAFGLTTKEADDRLRGGLWLFGSGRNFTSSNITPSLIAEGITENNIWDSLADIHFELSAPLVQDKLSLYVSLTSQALTRDIADFRPEDSSSVLAGLVSLDYRLLHSRLKLLWAGQTIHQAREGAGRDILPEVTREVSQGYDIFQLLWDRRLGDHHALRAGLGYVRGSVRSDFQDQAVGPCRVEILPDRFSGTAPPAGQDDRHILDAFLDGRLLSTNVLGGANLVEYGFKLRYAGASSRLRIMDNLHLRFFRGLPLEVILFNTPLEHKEASLEGQLYVQDT
ncbi:MAG: carboxypeptidase-like regulatory domain-containing protein, partial [Candidatus Aminicenantes bacterium]|nr:carboxypeptidase-like regulatory domain-containing protein [Candidatus Aminicenantes bacterium]